jgi:hypothetical protein
VVRIDGSHRFAWALGGIVVIAIFVRILFILGWTWGAPLHGDPLFFQQSGAHVAQGKGYVDRFLGHGPLVPTAEHPPAFSFLLAGLDLVAVRSVDAHRVALAFVSAGGVLAQGLFGRRLAGPGVGLFAAGIAAVDPLWVQQGGFVMSESLYLVIVPTMLLFALRCLDRPNRWNFLVLGSLIGIATLTRSEAVDFVLLLGVIVVVLAVGPWRERLVPAVAILAGVGLFLVPWLVRNDIQLGSLTLSTNEGFTLSGSYSHATFSPPSPEYGSFDEDNQFAAVVAILDYEKPPDHATHWTEATLTDAMDNGAKSYAGSHLSDLPGVVLAREGRTWGLYAPGTQLHYDVTEDFNGATGPKQAGQIMNWVLLPFACLGVIQLARCSKRRLLIVLVPIMVVAINAAVFYGSTRLRVAAEPSIDVLASIGLLWAMASGAHRARAMAIHRSRELPTRAEVSHSPGAPGSSRLVAIRHSA